MNFKKLCILGIILSLLSGCNLQRTGTSLLQEKKGSGRVTALSILDDQTCWVGGVGFIARSLDGGENWSTLYNGVQTIQQIYTLNTERVWVVLGVTDPQILSTRDGGKAWDSIGDLPISGHLHFISAEEGFVANAHTIDGGKNWDFIKVPKHLIGNPYFYDADNGWVVTEYKDNRTIQRTVDGGQTWNVVWTQASEGILRGAIIRSKGTNDAWVELIGDTRLPQTSYSLLHTSTGGSQWTTVLANSTSDAGPAPIAEGELFNINKGSKPGPFYAVSDQVAFMGGYSPASEAPNSIGWTTDGGQTWTNSEAEFPGGNGALLAMADEDKGWWICTDDTASILYKTSDGGKSWTKMHTFGGEK